MILRPRQEEFVEACLSALSDHQNTLGIAPTGAGKTVMLSSIAGEFPRVCVLQHREELVAQNRSTFQQVNPRTKTDLFTASRKRWSDGCTFAMMQTLVNHLDKMRPVDLVVVDETHRVGAPSYIKILNRFKELNPQFATLGVTATPERADGKALSHVFDNVADVISLAELVAEGHLVKPRTFVVDLDLRNALSGVKKLGADYDMTQVDRIMNTAVVNCKVVERWKECASDRRTVAFCATVEHAEQLHHEFRNAGFTAGVVHGGMGKRERKAILSAFDRGDIQVLCNCAVLTEGWDCQPVNCVLLCRPCSFRSTLIQMVGRGLRRVDPARYPGIIKDDCYVMDFGYSLLTYPDLFDVNDAELSAAQAMSCPKCATKLPKKIQTCPLCGHEFPRIITEEEASEGPGMDTMRDELHEFAMTEVKLMDLSPFKWEALFDGLAYVANGMKAEAFVLKRDGIWHAVGKAQKKAAQLLLVTHDKVQALSAADDFMRLHGDRTNAKKTKLWLTAPPSDRQMEMLGIGNPFAMNRYTASCHLSWKFNENALKLITGRSA